MYIQRKTTTAPAYPANESAEATPRFTRFAAKRVGRWRRQQALITAIEVLFVAGGVAALLMLR